MPATNPSHDDEIDAGKSARHSNEAGQETLTDNIGQRSDSDAAQVDQAGRKHKADGVGARVGSIRQLDAVRIAVTKSEDPDQSDRDHFERVPVEGNGQPQTQDRQGYSELDVWN